MRPIFALLCLLVTVPAFAELGESRDYPGNLLLYGTITQDDARNLRKDPRIVRGRPVILEVDTGGGDWSAALDMGRTLRRTQSSVDVRRGRQCLSACVMVLAGATDRWVNESSSVGIHRPFSPQNDVTSYAQSQARYRSLEAGARTYLREMNIPDSLFDAMVRIPARSIRMLSSEELRDFGLAGVDPAKAELDDSRDAASLGLTRTEYLERKRLVPTLCPLPDGPLSETEESYRKMELREECKARVFKSK